MRTFWTRGSIPGATRAALLGLALAAGIGTGPAMAQEAMSPEETYLDLHRGLNAKMLCERVGYSRSQHMEIAKAIDEQVGGDIGAGRRLSLTVRARSEMLRAMPGKGCGHADMAGPRAMFEEKIASQLPAAE